MVARVSGFILVVLVGSCSTYTSDLLSGSAQGGETTSGAAGQAPGGAGSAAVGGKPPGASGTATGGQLGSVGGTETDAGGMGGSSAGMVAAGAGGEGGAEPVPLPAGSGSITHERWKDVPGAALSDFPTDAPDEVSQVSAFKAPGGGGSNTADLMSGYITAPLDGNYRFWIACDDNCELWLSTDDSWENEVLIAFVDGIDRYTDADEWTKFASQESALIPLEAGKLYHVEALVKQGIGGSNLSVGWLKPGDAGILPSEVIPGRQLSPIDAL